MSHGDIDDCVQDVDDDDESVSRYSHIERGTYLLPTDQMPERNSVFSTHLVVDEYIGR